MWFSLFPGPPVISSFTGLKPVPSASQEPALPGSTGTPSALPARSRGGPRLADLQSLRGLAALMVVFFHASEIYKLRIGEPWLANVFRAGFVGVDVFFVISGFIILWVHREDLGHPGRVRSYAIKRAYRIFPLYWTVVLLKALKDINHLDWVTLVCAFLLIPYPSPPFINLSWTLTFEMLFYVTFAGAICLGFRWGMLLIAAVMGALAFLPQPLVSDGSVLATSVNFFFDQHVLEFLAGMAVAWALRLRNVWFPTAVAIAGVAAFTASLAYTTWQGIRADEVVLTLITIRKTSLFFGVPAALVVYGLVGRELAGRAPLIGWLKLLGESSYSLYMLHGYLIFNVCHLAAFRNLAARHPLMMMLPVLASVAVAAVAYRLIEKPFVERGRRRAAALPAA